MTKMPTIPNKENYWKVEWHIVLLHTLTISQDLPLALLSRLTLVTVLDASPEYLTKTTTNFTKASMVW